MKNIMVGTFALMISTLMMIPVVVADCMKGDTTDIQKAEANEEQQCLLEGKSWSECFNSSSDNSNRTELDKITQIINEASIGNLGAGLGTDSVAQSIRKSLVKGLLY